MKTIRGFTETELKLAVAQEKQSLVQERIWVVSQLRRLNDQLDQVDARMVELDKADGLLEGGL